MELKVCTVADAPLIRDLAEATYRETFAASNTEEDIELYVKTALAPACIEKELANEASTFVVAMDGARAAGYLKLNQAPAQTELNDPAALEIERIYTLGAFHGKGLGQLLMDYALERAEAEGKEYVWLGVWEHNLRAQRFYEKYGFTRFSEHIFKLGEDEQLDWLMRKDLR